MPRNRVAAFLTNDGGQTIILVGLFLVVFLGFIGLVADVGWLQLGISRAQRAADAAALAGAPYLPGNVAGAQSAAYAEATKNGFTSGVNGATVTATQDVANPNLLSVTVSTPVRTFMARFFGVNSFPTTRVSRAEFILPVPMGSPQAYYGIHQLCVNNGGCSVVNDPSSNPLATQGFWGAVIAKGGNRGNGDLYSTFYNGNPTTNGYFDPNGYSYLIDFPTGTTGGLVRIFDAPYCATGKNQGGSGQQLGTGDHWIGGSGRMTTEYILWNTQGTPYDTSDDTPIPTDGTTFVDEEGVDYSSAFGGNRAYGGTINSGNYTSKPDCSANPYHNAWWTMNAANPLGPGQYRLQVKTSDSRNNNTNAENMFGILATTSSAGTVPHVYGQSRMCDYVNVVAGNQEFYLAQIAAVHAGKTLQITVHDPGDVGGGNAYLKFRLPTATGWSDATFNWSASGGSSGTNVTQLQVGTASGSLFDNQIITILIGISPTYSAPQLGWWKVEYDVNGAGNDTATWAVTIRGNPVHLIVP